MFLMISLAVTPLRRIARFNQLVDVRRMIGVGAFVYAAAHISLYVADQMFDLWKVASEIVLRLYLTIGFVALLGLAALAATSTDGMVRRLGGKRWQRLHQAIYGIGAAGADPFLSADQGRRLGADLRRRPVRLDDRLSAAGQASARARDEPPAWMLLALSVAVAALTFLAEAIGIGLAFNVSPLLVLRDRASTSTT